MAKQGKERNETEHLRGEIRNLKSQVKHLKRELARAEKNTKKQEAMYQELTTATELDNYATPEVNDDINYTPCPKCSSKLKELDLGLRVLYTCNKDGCGYRRTMAKK